MDNELAALEHRLAETKSDAALRVRELLRQALSVADGAHDVFSTHMQNTKEAAERDLRMGDILFPSTTVADDVLHFPKRDVHYRITVRYYDFKRFASHVSIVELQ